MTLEAKSAYAIERRAAASAADTVTTWRHLERAHIVAQPFAVAHVGSHVAMLRQAVRDRDVVEVGGQIVRVLVAGPPSLLGRYPIGNTGRARVPLRARLPVPRDLEVLGPVTADQSVPRSQNPDGERSGW